MKYKHLINNFSIFNEDDLEIAEVNLASPECNTAEITFVEQIVDLDELKDLIPYIEELTLEYKKEIDEI